MHPEVRQALSKATSPLHDALLSHARRRLEASEKHWSQRHTRWRESERLYRAFRIADRSDREVRGQSLTEGVEKIVVPFSYAVLQSMLAWFMTVFSDRKPLIPVEGISPDDARAAIFHEHLLQRQLDQMQPKGMLVWMQWFLDTLRYGVGIVKRTWTIREFPTLQRTFTPTLDPLTGLTTMHEEFVEQDVVSYEGNELENILPYNFYPDPRLALAEFQRGDFCAFKFQRSDVHLRQRQAEGVYVGLQYVPEEKDRNASAYASVGGQPSDLYRIADMDEDANQQIDDQGKPFKNLYELYTYLNPADLGVQGTRPAPLERPATPKLWVLTIANMGRVIRAEHANLPARNFPADIIEINYDLHSPSNFGMIEMFRGLQYHLSWLFNSRMTNVRRSLNNELVVDPLMIEEEDILRPNPAGLWRLTKRASGAGIPLDQVVRPLPIIDVTASHHTDARVVTDLIEQITGANRLIMGLPNPGRRAATEVQGQLSLASGRMKLLATIASAQGLEPQAEGMTRNNQLFIEGPFPLQIRPEYRGMFGTDVLTVTPDLLQGNFRFPFLESGMPTDRAFEISVWKELMALGMQGPGAAQIMAGLNFPEIMARLFKLLGVKNFGDFFTVGQQPTQVSSDEDVQNAVSQGTLVPTDQFAMPPPGSVPNTGGNGLNGAG
jgi:hypothetical protein